MALALSINTGPGAFYGDKYKVEEVHKLATESIFELLLIRLNS